MNRYSSRVKQLFDHACVNKILFSTIASRLESDNYIGIDIGANNGNDACELQKYIASTRGFTGEIICIDPFPTGGDVIGIDGESYIMSTSLWFDFILCKFSIHHIQDKYHFFQKCYQRLHQGGVMYIMTCSKESEFPWNASLQTSFIRSCSFLESDIITFPIKKNVISFDIDLVLDDWKDIVENKRISNLLMNSDQEIQQCLAEWNHQKSKKFFTAKIKIDFYEITKQNCSPLITPLHS